MKRWLPISLVFGLIGSGPFLFAGGFKKQQEPPMVMEVSPETLERHVRKLSEEFVPRDGDHVENLERAAGYIRQVLKDAGGRVSDQSFHVPEYDQNNSLIQKGPYRNIIASYGPETGERIVIGAHYDAAELHPGADDNASGVAGLLELAQLLKKNPPPLRTDLVAYTLEEPPYFRTEFMGSAVHAAGLAKDGVKVRFMMSLEMLGYYSDAPDSQMYPLFVLKWFYPSKGNFLALVGRFGSGGLTRRLAKRMRAATPLPISVSNAPSWVPGIDFSDHMSYWRQGFPAVMATDTAFCRNVNYHTAEDTAEKLDYPRMAQAVTAVYAAIRDER